MDTAQIDPTLVVNILNNLILAVIPVLTPLVIAALKKVVIVIPKPILPLIAMVIGAVATVLAQSPSLGSIATGAALGLAGVGVRELVDQGRKVAADA